MRSEDIYRHVRKRPFQPFRIYMSDGTIYDVRHPEMIMVGRSAVVIGLPGGSSEPPIYDRAVDCALIHITRLEPLNGAA